MNAPFPFDDSDPSSDILLISPDDVYFHAHKNILSLASSFFQDLIPLVQNPSDGSLPIVYLTEGSNIVDKVLRFCYPIPDPSFADVSEIYQVAEATHKYLMNDVTNRLPSQLRNFVSIYPLHTFVVACKLNWKREVDIAASKVLAKPLFAHKEDMPELDLPSLRILYRFAQFHERRMSVIRSAFLDMLDRVQVRCTVYFKGPPCDMHDIWDDTPQFHHPLPRKSYLLHYGATLLRAMLLSPTMETLTSTDVDARESARTIAMMCPNCAQDDLDVIFDEAIPNDVLAKVYKTLDERFSDVL